MNNVGITQWQDSNSDYPLKNPGNLSGIFCDASFISFDGFIPSLVNVAIVEANLVFKLKLDDGVQTFVHLLNQTAAGVGVKLRNLSNTRNYGTVVFGRLISDIVAGVYGSKLNVNILFDPITVRTINSNDGVYSLNNAAGSVAITLDRSIQFDGNIFTAVSVPSNLETVTTSPSQVYIHTDTGKIFEFSGSNSEYLIRLGRKYTAVTNTGSIFIGAYTNEACSIYSLEATPNTTLLNNLEFSGQPGNIIGLTVAAGSNVWALSSVGKLRNLGLVSNLSLTPDVEYRIWDVNTATYLIPKALASVDGNLIVAVDGALDYSDTSRFSSTIYAVNPVPIEPGKLGVITQASMVTSSGNNHLLNIDSLTTIDNVLYGIAANLGEYTIYSIDPETCISTALGTFTPGESSAQVLGIFSGGHLFVKNPIIPLKSVNGIPADELHSIFITDSNVINVTPRNNNTLEFSLTVPDKDLNVVRTTHYE